MFTGRIKVDIFVEKLVKKKLDGNDMLIIGGSIALAVVVISGNNTFFGSLRCFSDIVSGSSVFDLYGNFIKKN